MRLIDISHQKRIFATASNTEDQKQEEPTIQPPPRKNPIRDYMELSKFRLSSLVLLSTMFGYAVAPGDFDAIKFAVSSIGTGLCIASANSINQYLEEKLDAKMTRTRGRPIPTGRISKKQAITFGSVVGLLGGSMLYIGVDGLTAALAVSNIAIYTCIYTPMKRMSTINTYVGSIVGGIPPLIGWVAASGSLDMGSMVTFMLLYLWQIPHFMALSWSCKADYEKGGYKMLSVVNPKEVPLMSLIYSIATLPLGAAAAYYGITDVSFAMDSILLDLWLIYKAKVFYDDPSSQNARNLFFVTLKWLPAFMLLMLAHHYYHNYRNMQKQKEFIRDLSE